MVMAGRPPPGGREGKNPMKRLNTALTMTALLLVTSPAHATDPVEIPWAPRGLVGADVHVVELMSGDLYVGAADGLHILDLPSGTWLPLAREGAAGWPVTAVGRSPYREDRVITGRVDDGGLGAIALTALADGATEVRLGGLPGPLSKVDFSAYFDNYRLWACAPGVGVAGRALPVGRQRRHLGTAVRARDSNIRIGLSSAIGIRHRVAAARAPVPGGRRRGDVVQ